MNRPIRLTALRRAAEQHLARPSWNDVGTWILAFATAIGLWLFVNSGERASERTVRIRLEASNLPGGLVVTNQITDHVEVQVSGPGIILSSIDARRLRATLDLSGVRPGVATYTVGRELLHLPRKVEVLRVTPSQVSFNVDRVARRSVPVRLDQKGELHPGLKLLETELNPAKVDVTGPSSVLERLRSIDTEPLELGSLRAGKLDRRLNLVAPDDMVRLVRAQVVLQLAIETVMAQREFRQVAVELTGDRQGWRVSPERVNLVVRGPEAELEKLAIDGAVVVTTDSADGGKPKRVKPVVRLPEGFEVVRQEPPEVTLKPVGATSTPKRRSASARGTGGGT